MSKDYIFISDVDGTILRTNKPIGAAVIQAANAYTSAGGKLAICTGRTILATAKLAEKIGINAPCILTSGTCLYDFKAKKVLWLKKFQKDIFDILDYIYCNFPDVSLQAYAPDNVYNLRKIPFMEEAGVYEEKSLPECTIADIKGDIVKLGMSSHDIPLMHEIADELMGFDMLECAFASEHFIEITPEGVNKGTALRMIAGKLNIPHDHIFVAGDAMTDMPILGLAGVSFAPEDAPEAVKRVCTKVIPRPEEDGIKEAFMYAVNVIKNGG